MTFAFPFPAIDPEIVRIGPFAMRWYALAYVAGIALGWLYAASLLRQPTLWRYRTSPMPAETIGDFVVWATIGIVVGGRLGYVLFYDFDYFMLNPSQIPAVWQGGMAFHGGLIGVLLAMLGFAWTRGVSFLSLADVITAAAPIGLFFGRVANFINGELYGRPSDVPWAMVFPKGGPAPRHPSQIYEALLEGLLLFVLLRLCTHYFGFLQRPGAIGGAFLVGYGAARSFVELFRMPDAQVGLLQGGLTMGQLLSLPMILIGLMVIAYSYKRASEAP